MAPVLGAASHTCWIHRSISCHDSGHHLSICVFTPERWPRQCSRELAISLEVWPDCLYDLPIQIHFLPKGFSFVRARANGWLVNTLLGILWARVELQVLRYTPWWSARQRKHTATDEYHLDYTEMLLPTVLMQSIKRKHYMVAIASTVTLLLKLQVVLSTSIFQMAIVRVETPVTTTSLDTFVARDHNYPVDNEYEARASVDSFRHFGVPLPFGVSESCAYQQYSPHFNIGASPSRPSMNRPLTTVVDGLFMETECLKLENYTVHDGPLRPWDITIKSENCDTPVTAMFSPSRYNGSWQLDEAKGDKRPCPDLPQDNSQWVWSAVHYEYTNDGELEIDVVAAVPCSSRAWLSQVEIFDDGISQNVIQLSGPRVPFDIDPRVLVSPYNSTMAGGMDAGDTSIIGTYHGFLNQETNVQDASIYNTSLLYDATTTLMAYYGPIAAHSDLRQERESPIESLVVENQARLQVNLWVCAAVATLFTICALFVFLTLVTQVHSQILREADRRDPLTLLGSILLVQSDSAFSNKLRQSILATGVTNPEPWSQCQFTPLVQRRPLRAAFLLFLFALIVSLGITWQQSLAHNGLATVPQDGYISLTWQSVPALAMLVVLLYFLLYSNSIDLSLRSLASISHLRAKAASSPEMDESFLDMIGLRVLLSSFQRRMFHITLSQALAMACTFLPTLSSVLFASQLTPGAENLTIQQESWFGVFNGSERYDYLKRNPIIMSVQRMNAVKHLPNFTYPQNTYGELLFPKFTLPDALWRPGKSANVTIPAVRVASSCVKLGDDNVEIRLTVIPGSSTQMSALQNYTCPGESEVQTSTTKIISGYPRNDTYFAHVLDSPARPGFLDIACNPQAAQASEFTQPPWQHVTYFWGRTSPLSDPGFSHIAVWECNYTWVDVSTEMTVLYSDGDMFIDHENPPRPAESSDRPRLWEPPFSMPYLGRSADATFSAQLPEVFPTPDLPHNASAKTSSLDGRFNYLIEPYGLLTIEDFGDPDQHETILEALRSQMSTVLAAMVNLGQRFDVNEESVMPPFRHGYLQPINATVIDQQRHHRLIQDQGVTITIITILCIVFLFHAWALLSGIYRALTGDTSQQPWLLDIGVRGVAPPQFATIGMMECLLRDSNAAKMLPPDAHGMPTDELHGHLAGRQFRLGWFHDLETETQVYTLGIEDEGRFEFVGEEGDSRKG